VSQSQTSCVDVGVVPQQSILVQCGLQRKNTNMEPIDR
jgi:hypothetical protein